MITPIIRIEIYKKLGTGTNIYYSESPDYILEGISNCQISYGIDKSRDSIDFSILNHSELSNNVYKFSKDLSYSEGGYQINTRDLLKIYAWNEPMTGVKEDHLILNTFIKSFSYNSSGAVGEYSITCFNRTEVLLNSFMFMPFNVATRVPVMIIASINRLMNYNRNDRVYAYMDYSGTTSPGVRGAYDYSGQNVQPSIGRYGYVRAYKAAAYQDNGTLKTEYTSTVPSDLLLKESPMTESYKSFVDHLSTLSTPEYNGDSDGGTYIFYVDKDNNLIWKPGEDTVITTLNEYEHPSIKLTKDVDEVYNAIIVNCGTDPNQNGILTFEMDGLSMAKYGARWKYLPRQNIADEIHKYEVKSTAAGGNNAGGKIEQRYPRAEDYPWTIQTTANDERWGEYSYTAHVSTVADDDEYKDYIRNASKTQGRIEARDIISRYSDAIYSCEWELENGTLDYVPNKMINLNIPSIGFQKKLRITNIRHSFTDSWITTLVLKEDVEYNFRHSVDNG